jgi:uncharacterized protein YukE
MEMATLHMDVETSRKVVSQMRKTCDNLHTEVADLSNSMKAFIGSSWISPAGSEFSNDINEWSQALRIKINELEALTERLEREIAEWEATAQQM